MKTFYTFISRVLLVVFTSNCLMPSWSWAQLLDRNNENTSAQGYANWNWESVGNFGKKDGKDESAGQKNPLYHRVAEAVNKTDNKEDACRRNIAAYYQAYLEAFQVKDMADALNSLYLTAEECKAFIQKKPEQFPATIAATQTSASFEDYFQPTEHALQDVIEFADRLVDRNHVKDYIKYPAHVSQVNHKYDEQYKQLYEDRNKEGSPFSGSYEEALAYVQQIKQKQSKEVFEPIMKIVGEEMEYSFAAQVLAQTFSAINDGFDQIPYDAEFVRLLKQMQLRLLHQLGGYVSQGKNGEPVVALTGSVAAHEFVDDYAKISFRGWARLALLRIRKIYKKMGLNDPLGDAYLSTQMNHFKQELAQFQNTRGLSQFQIQRNMTRLSIASVFSVFFALEQGQDVKRVIQNLEPTSKRNKFLHGQNDAIAVALSQVQQVILADPQSAQSKRLFNDLVTMATDPKFALSTQVLALQNLAELEKTSNGALNFGAVSGKLACHAGDLYAPLVAQDYDSYGLDVGQMVGLSELLKNFYETFNGPKRFLDWKKGEIKGVLSVDDYKGHAIVRPDPNVFYEDSVKDTFALHEVESLVKQTAWKAKKCDNTEFTMYAREHRNWFKESADLNKEFIKFVVEMISFDLAFRLLTPVIRTMWGVVVATPLRTARGVAIALPDAAKAVKLGKGLAGARAEIQQGIKVSNITGKLKAGERVGINLKATAVLADGTPQVYNVNRYHKLRNVLKNPNLQEIALFQNGIKEYELTGNALKELSSVSKAHTWEALTQNMKSVAGWKSSLSLKALQGSPFKPFNPALQMSKQNLIRTKAIRQMAEDGMFDLRFGLPKKPGATAAKDFDWFVAGEGSMDDFAKVFLNRGPNGKMLANSKGLTLVDSKGLQEIQVILTPKYMRNPGLIPQKWGLKPFTSARSEVKELGKWIGSQDGGMLFYSPMSEVEKASLLGDFASAPRLFGVTDEAIGSMVGRSEFAGRFISKGQPFGSWAGEANKFISMTPQSGLPFNYIVKNTLPFQEMWASMGSLAVAWTSFIGMDVLAYEAGMQKWPERVAQRDVNKFIDSLPEISAQRRENEQNGNAQKDSRVPAHDFVASKADPERSGALFGSLITMGRYGVSKLGISKDSLPGKLGIGQFTFVSDDVKDYLRYNEGVSRFNNALGFANAYGSFHQALAQTSATAPSSQFKALADDYAASLEQIKNDKGLSYFEKSKQTEQLVLSWNKDFSTIQYAQLEQQHAAQEAKLAEQRAAQEAEAEKTYSKQKEFIEKNIALGEINEVLTEQEAEEYRFQLHSIDKQQGHVSDKVMQAATLGAEVYLEICSRYYGDRLVTALFLENGYRPNDFSDLISSHRRTIAELKKNSAEADEFISAFKSFAQAVEERADMINGANLGQR